MFGHTRWQTLVVLSLILASGSQTRIEGAVVTISGTEVWDGLSIPGGHAADGVTLLGGVYTIPDGVVINVGGVMQLNNGFNVATASNIVFDFVNGGLHFNTTGNAIDVYEGFRDGPNRSVTFDMNGNDITAIAGGGKFFHSTPGRDPRAINIDGGPGGNVALESISIPRLDGAVAPVSIIAGGAIAINTIDTTDNIAGGSPGGDVTVQGEVVTLGNISTFSERNDTGPNGAAGNVLIEALGYSSFDELDYNNNDLDNVLTLEGVIRTEGTIAADQLGGDIVVRGVMVELGGAFNVIKEANANLAIHAGILLDGYTEDDLFIDGAPGVFTADFDVNWIAPPPVPEPASWTLLGLGVAALAFRVKRRNSAVAVQ